jgi:hypothetical protein
MIVCLCVPGRRQKEANLAGPRSFVCACVWAYIYTEAPENEPNRKTAAKRTRGSPLRNLAATSTGERDAPSRPHPPSYTFHTRTQPNPSAHSQKHVPHTILLQRLRTHHRFPAGPHNLSHFSSPPNTILFPLLPLKPPSSPKLHPATDVFECTHLLVSLHRKPFSSILYPSHSSLPLLNLYDRKGGKMKRAGIQP